MKSIPVDNLYMYGGFKSLNMTALYVLGTNFKSNSACFVFATGMFGYMNFPQYISYLYYYDIFFVNLKYKNLKLKNNHNSCDFID